VQPPIDYIARTRDQYSALGYPPYDWVHNGDEPPFATPSKPLNEASVGLIASGGIYVKGQIAFHFRDDFSYREIDNRTPPTALRATHFAYDLKDVRKDANVVFPLETLHEIAAAGIVGEVGPRAYTFMGGIYSSRKVAEILAPALADRLVTDEVDLALLVPA